MRIPTGRFEHRIARAEVVELLHLDELPMKKHGAITENVSPRGARVITDVICTAGKPVLLDAPEEDLKLTARVVYCQRLEEHKFALGLQLEVRVEKWKKSVQL